VAAWCPTLFMLTKYYYIPDVRHPDPHQEVLINKKKWDELTPDLLDSDWPVFLGPSP
jgi:hypothetical protein